MKIDLNQKIGHKTVETKGISIMMVKVAFQMIVVQQALRETTPDWSRLDGSEERFQEHET